MSGDFKDAQAHLLNATPAEMNGIASAGFMNFKARIDHVFSGEQIEFSSFEHTAPYGKAHPWRKLSDHSPLVGRFGVSTK